MVGVWGFVVVCVLLVTTKAWVEWLGLDTSVASLVTFDVVCVGGVWFFLVWGVVFCFWGFWLCGWGCGGVVVVVIVLYFDLRFCVGGFT